MTRNFNRS
jgi:hypothetical protein